MAMEESVTPYVVGNVVGSLKRGRGGEPDLKLNKHGKPKRRRK